MFKTEVMEENSKTIGSLVESVTEYGKTSFELARLKVAAKLSEVVSSLIPNMISIIFAIIFLLFLSLGIALWIGEILGQTFYGFFVVAGFYGLTGMLIHFVMHKGLKRRFRNNFIQLLFK